MVKQIVTTFRIPYSLSTCKMFGEIDPPINFQLFSSLDHRYCGIIIIVGLLRSAFQGHCHNKLDKRLAS